MPPPPKPPVICYDLQTNANARRAPCSRYKVSAIGLTSRKSKVTVIPPEEAEIDKLRTDRCWHHNYEHEADDEYEVSRRVSTRPRITPRRVDETTREPLRRNLNYQPIKSNNQESRTLSFGSSADRWPTTLRQQQVRHEYDQKLKERLRKKERLEERKRQEADMEAELDAITAKLEMVKKVHANLTNTYGMSHNAARYFQKTDEEYANLRRKLDQFAQTRSKEVERQLQQRKKLHKFQQQEDKEVEVRRLKAMQSLAPNRYKMTSTLNGSLSPNSRTPSSSSVSTRNSPPSTLSCCSSPLSSLEHPESPRHNLSHHNSKFAARPNPSSKCPIASSTPSSLKSHNSYNKSIMRTQSKRPPMDFSFYKGPPDDDRETLEVTDLNFLEKVEDKTMLEVNELLNNMQSALRDSYNEHRESPRHNSSQHNSKFAARLSPLSKSPISYSTPSSLKPHNSYNKSIMRTRPKKPLVDFSFYKGPPDGKREILEVTDVNFLEKMEDSTMLEVNRLLNNMQSTLGDSHNEHTLYHEAADISQN